MKEAKERKTTEADGKTMETTMRKTKRRRRNRKRVKKNRKRRKEVRLGRGLKEEIRLQAFCADRDGEGVRLQRQRDLRFRLLWPWDASEC